MAIKGRHSGVQRHLQPLALVRLCPSGSTPQPQHEASVTVTSPCSLPWLQEACGTGQHSSGGQNPPEANGQFLGTRGKCSPAALLSAVLVACLCGPASRRRQASCLCTSSHVGDHSHWDFHLCKV